MPMVTSGPAGEGKMTGALDGAARALDERHVEPHAVS